MAITLLVPKDANISSWLGFLVVAIIIRLVITVVYRAYFHPLAHIPGPWLAGVTPYYVFYYNSIVGGQFYLHVEKLHKQYGPVVRITPDEVHLINPDNYEVIYHVGTKYSKSPKFYRAFGCDSSTFSAASNEVHRQRRTVLNPLFSRKTVLQLENIIQSKVQKLSDRVGSALSAGASVDLYHGLRAVSVDVITDYAFGLCYDLLDKQDFSVDFFLMVRSLGPPIWFFMEWPFLRTLAVRTPLWFAELTNKPLAAFIQLMKDCRSYIVKIKESVDAGEHKAQSRTTIFHELLDRDVNEGNTMQSIDELKDEAFVFIAAATESSGNAMTITAYHAIRNQEIYHKLAAELTEAFPDPTATLDYLMLERLPYLTAVIKEGLRLSYGVVGRLPRQTPERGAIFDGYNIPGGTIVGMSSYLMHRDPSIFADPLKFSPERWLSDSPSSEAAVRRLEKYFVPFSKGTRQCIGMNLAYAELYITLGTIFRRFGSLKALELRDEDLAYQDFFSAYNPVDGRKFTVVGGAGDNKGEM